MREEFLAHRDARLRQPESFDDEARAVEHAVGEMRQRRPVLGKQGLALGCVDDQPAIGPRRQPGTDRPPAPTGADDAGGRSGGEQRLAGRGVHAPLRAEQAMASGVRKRQGCGRITCAAGKASANRACTPGSEQEPPER